MLGRLVGARGHTRAAAPGGRRGAVLRDDGVPAVLGAGGGCGQGVRDVRAGQRPGVGHRGGVSPRFLGRPGLGGGPGARGHAAGAAGHTPVHWQEQLT